MELRKVKIEELHFAKYNPRKDLKSGDVEYQKLKNSILEFGYVDPIIWNETTGNVVGGHQRLKVLIALGRSELDCVVLHLDETNEKALNIALNKVSGEWDMSLLKDLLKNLEANSFNLELSGFDKIEIDSLFERAAFEIKEDDFDLESAYEEIAEPVTKPGDIWQLGRHRLICGDCTDENVLKKLMDGATADLIVTDPPYNVNYIDIDTYRTKSKKAKHNPMQNDKLSNSEFYRFLFAFYKNVYDVMKGGGVIYVFHATSETANFITALQAAGFKHSQILVWVKNHFVIGRNDYQWRHEPILYGWKTQEKCPHFFVSDRTQSTVFNSKELNFDVMKKSEMKKLLKAIYTDLNSTAVLADKPLKNKEHPTMKPIDLIAKFIYNSSREGELVLDPFCGSGTTILAAEQLGRKCYASEIDQRYCDVIVKRYNEFYIDCDTKLIRDGIEVVLKL